MAQHLYDGKERRFRDSDANCADALPIIAKLLGMSAAPATGSLRYDLSFFSGGIGVHDVLGITYPCSLTEFEQIAVRLNAKEVAAAAADPGWSEDFLWLIKAH